MRHDGEVVIYECWTEHVKTITIAKRAHQKLNTRAFRILEDYARNLSYSLEDARIDAVLWRIP